jgi:hypothetical protein
MSIKLSCGGCKKSFRVKEELAGKRVKCPACKNVLPVPALDDDESDDREPDEQTGSVFKRLPLAWLAAGVAVLLLLLSLPVALYGLYAASSATGELATAEARSKQAIAALSTERAGLQDKLHGMGSEIGKLKQRLADTEELTRKSKAEADKLAQRARDAEAQLGKEKAEADDLRKQFGQPSQVGKKEKPPADPVPPKADGAATRELIVGRWRDAKNAKRLVGGKTWGDIEFSGDGTLAITVRDTKISTPLTLNGRYKVLDGERAEITLDGKTTSSNFDTPPWTTIEMAAALLKREAHTKTMAISVSKTALTIAGTSYERVDATVGEVDPVPKKLDPVPKKKGGFKLTTLVRARRVLLNDGKVLTPTVPESDVVLLLKIEGVPANVMTDGFGLFKNSYVMAGGKKQMFTTMTVPASGNFIVAAGVIPATARKATLHINGMAAVPLDLPAMVLDSVNEAK